VSLVCNKLYKNRLQERENFEDLGIDKNTKIVYIFGGEDTKCTWTYEFNFIA